MNLIVPLFIIGVLMITNISIKPSEQRNGVLSASISISPTLPVSLTPSPSSSPTEVPKKQNVIIEITNEPSNLPSQNIIYPNSFSIGGNSYESNDNPQLITDWYKNIIKEKKMNTTSVVTTNTNDNIKNVLAADNGVEKLHVEIVKNSGDGKTTIKLN